MKWLLNLWHTSIGKKQLMSITGILLSLFLIGHLSGNFLIFVGADAFNAYAHFLISQPWLPVVELGLAGIFLLHVITAIRLTLENNEARPQPYVFKDPVEASLASRTMIITGVLVFAFLILHLIDFKFGNYHSMEDGLFGLVVQKLSHPVYGGVYIICMLLVGFHLSHGVQSAFQSFGLNHPAYRPAIKGLGWLLALGIGLGFASIPAWLMLTT